MKHFKTIFGYAILATFILAILYFLTFGLYSKTGNMRQYLPELISILLFCLIPIIIGRLANKKRISFGTGLCLLPIVAFILAYLDKIWVKDYVFTLVMLFTNFVLGSQAGKTDIKEYLKSIKGNWTVIFKIILQTIVFFSLAILFSQAAG